MDNKHFHAVCNIIFGFLTAGLFYLAPYIAWHTMEGDKTDIVMGMVLGFIPTGLLLLSLLHGFLTKRAIVSACTASILGIPAIFIPIIAGNTLIERGFALIFIVVIIFVIVYMGTVSGIFIRRLILMLCRGTFFKKGN